MGRLKKISAVFGIALIIGILSGSLFRSSYFDELKAVMDSFCNDVVNHSLYMGRGENIVLFINVLVKRGIPFALLWILEYNRRFRMFFIIWLCAAGGFVTGFVCQFFVCAYTGISLQLILAYFFPHYILYAVSYLLSILYITSGMTRKKAMMITVLSVILVSGALAETYINPELLEIVLKNSVSAL